MTITNTIDEFTGTSPNRSQPAEDFETNVGDFLPWMEGLAVDLNTTIGEINSTVAGINSDIATATNAANTATEQATIATTQASNSASSATLSEKWASEAEDVLVDATDYSAKHYATKAAASVSSLPAGTINDSIITTTTTWSSDKINSVAYVVTKPSITSPTSGSVDFYATVTTDAYATSNTYTGAQDYVEWEMATDALFTSIVDSYSGTGNLSTWDPVFGAPLTTYYLRVRKGSDNHISEWSGTVSFTRPDAVIETPVVTVEGSPSDVPESPVISTSAFVALGGSDTHLSTDWIVVRTSDSVVVHSNLGDTTNLLSYTLPDGILEVSTEYEFRAVHNGATYGASGAGSVVGTTKSQFIPTEAGTPFGGGYYVGVIDSGTERYALIVSPKASGESAPLQYKPANSDDSGPESYWDGEANTASINNSSHPAAQFCSNLSIGGFTDWYLPARDELELLYRNLKPTTTSNATGSRPESGSHGENANSDPIGVAYTSGDPSQTGSVDFQTGGEEAFEAQYYWPSTEYAPDTSGAWLQNFGNGRQNGSDKTNYLRVRAVRKIAL